MIEEQVLERDGMLDKKLLAKLTIYHRPGDDAHIGELYLDHDYVEDQSKGATCRFAPQSSSVGQKNGHTLLTVLQQNTLLLLIILLYDLNYITES